jgi:hypothetical protein
MAPTMSPVDATHMAGDEKYKASHVEAGSQRSELSDDEEYTPAEQKKIIHRVDRRLVLTCGIMYCISLMDRTNLGQASIAGMTKELKLAVGFRYVSFDADKTVAILTNYLEYYCPRLFHNLCHFPASCYGLVQEDWSSDIPLIHHTCLGSGYGRLRKTCSSQ